MTKMKSIYTKTLGFNFISNCVCILCAFCISYVYCYDVIACSNVKYAYSSKGFDDDVPSAAISGEHLRICERGMTCCTEEMEHKLSTHSRAEFDKLLHNTVGELRDIFETHTRRFDEFFRELIKLSRRDFHDMFVKTYGQMYEQNSYLFSTMFDDLEKYYITGGVDLEEAMDSFFHRLYRKMFPVLNAQHKFTERYLSCVEEHMTEMRPFGDVPNKLVVDVKKSFTATRTFVQALAVARDVVRSIMDVGLTPECSRALMKMTYCPHCHGLPDLKPCSPYCLQVLNSCLGNHIDLGIEWNAFIDALINLMSRIENSFNIETVLEPIDIKISEGIMNFQENAAGISKKIFQKCGKPRLGKRDISSQEINLEKLKFTHHQAVRPTTAAGTSVDRLAQNLKRKTKHIKKFWNDLPAKLCNHIQTDFEHQKEGCWNGHQKTNGILNSTLLKDFTDDNRQNAIINQQTLTLKLITTKLSHAYKGLDVQWEDTSDLTSGSGSGSGYGEDFMPNTHEDIFFSIPTSWPTHKATVKVQRPTMLPSSTATIYPLWTIVFTFAVAIVKVSY